MANLDDAKATLRTCILDDLIAEMPRGSYDYLQRAADIAVRSLDDPAIRWAVQEIGKQAP